MNKISCIYFLKLTERGRWLFRHFYGKKRSTLTQVNFKIWTSLLDCFSPPSLGWLLSLLFWPPTMKQESKFFSEDKDAFYKTMNIYFSWGGSHSPFLVYRQPLEQFLISETLFPFTWTHLKTLQSSECSHCWLSQTWSQRIIVLCGEERKELLVKEKSIHHLHSKNGTAAGEGTLSLTADLSFSPGWTQTALGVNGVNKGNSGK